MKKQSILVTVDFKSINNLETFLKWADEVNFCPNVETMNYLQDIYGRSTTDDIRSLVEEIVKSNKNYFQKIIFSVNKCMGSDWLLQLLRFYTEFVINREVLEMTKGHNDEINKAYRAEIDAKNEARKLEIRVTELERENAALKNEVSYLTGRNSDHVSRLYELAAEKKTAETWEKNFNNKYYSEN